MKKKVACGEFVKRQTPESGYSHYNGSWEDLESLTEYFFVERPETRPAQAGYRDGVMIQELPADKFYSAVVDLDENTKLNAAFAPRRIGEDPFVRVSAKAIKQQAKHASVVLYRRDVLVENGENETDADWEIVAIKARTTDEEEPMDPYTMARNFLQMKGGTKGEFTAEQFAKSIVYWNTHCMTTGAKSKLYKKFRKWARGY